MIITLLVIVAVAVGVFLFVKNNKNKVEAIDNAAEKVKEEAKKVFKKDE